MDKIFISYSRKDELFTRKLAKWLHDTLQVGVWMDVEDIEPGKKWSSAIQEGLDNADVMLVIITPSSMNSINVEDEWQYFLDQGKPIIPILLETAVIPYQLKRIQYIDFSLSSLFPEAQRQLISQVRYYLNPTNTEKRDAQKRKQNRQKGQSTQSAKDQVVEQTLKRQFRVQNTIIALLSVIVLLLIGLVGFLFFVSTDVITVTALSGNNTAVVYLPNQTEAQPISEVKSIPSGSRIVTNEDSIMLASSTNEQSAVLQPNSEILVDNFTDSINVGVNEGSVSIDTGNLLGGLINTVYGQTIDLSGQSIGIEVNEESNSVSAACYDGSCNISDETGKNREIETGQSLTYDGDAGDFDTAEIEQIPGSIVFTTFRHGPPEIYTMNPDGGNLKRLTQNGVQDFQPTWSPDGQKIAYVSGQTGKRTIFVMNSDGSNPVNLTPSQPRSEYPAWSPDGTRIAFTVYGSSGTGDIYVMNADGSNIVQITNEARDDYDPAWSPDGRYIAFVSNRDNNAEIYIMNADGSEQMNITQNPANDESPTWSSKNKIAFTSLRDYANAPEIYAMNPDGTEVVRLTDNTVFDVEPYWSPTGTQIVFSSQRDGNNEIFVMSFANPAEVQNITQEFQTADEQPAWMPLIRAGRP